MYNKYYNDIISQIKEIAPVLMPEWKFDSTCGGSDAGSELALIFARFLAESREKFALMPERQKIEFYNLLGAKAFPAHPSSGFVYFTLSGTDVSGSFIQKGFKLFSPSVGEEGKHFAFETAEDVFVASVSVNELVFTDYENDCLCFRNDDTTFSPANASKLFRGFTFTHEYFNRGLRIYLHPDCRIDFCDCTKVRWYAGSEELFLIREKSKQRLCGLPDDNINCVGVEILDITEFEQFTVNDIFIEAYGENILPDAIVANGEIQLEHTFYPFDAVDSHLAEQDEMFFFCDSVLSLKKSHITLCFDIDFEVEELSDYYPPQMPDKFIVMKKNLPKPEISDIVIENIAWEYYNGLGYAPLPIKTVNAEHEKKAERIFADIQNNFCKIEFICPDDIEPIITGAINGYGIRARIRKLRNAYKRPARVFIPKIGGASFSCEAPRVPIMQGMWENLGVKKGFSSFSEINFCRPHTEKPVLYFGFDKPPLGGVIRLFLSCKGDPANCTSNREWQYYVGGMWKTLKVFDSTNGFTQNGVISFEVIDSEQLSIYGRTAFWIRCVFEESPLFTIERIYINAVRVIQRETVLNENYYVAQDGKFDLKHTNIIDEEIFILSDNEKILLSDGKHYFIDRASGRVEFSSELKKTDGFSIKVNCRFTEGKIGNLEANSVFIPSLVTGYVNKAVNPFPLTGGNDCETPYESAQRTAKRLRHSNKCVTSDDYIDIIRDCGLIEFKEVSAIECSSVDGNITVIITLNNYNDTGSFFDMEKRISNAVKQQIPAGICDLKIKIVRE